MKTKFAKRLLSLLLMLTMVMSIMAGAVVAWAADGDEDLTIIDKDKTGSITVYKYVNTNNTKDSTETGTGNDVSGDPVPGRGTAATGVAGQTIPTGYTAINGATFKLFQIADADKVMEMYSGKDDTTYNVSQFTYDSDADKAYYNSNALTLVTNGTKETATIGTENGKIVYENLPVGIYGLVEVTAPDQVTAPLSEKSIISIPMVNTATSSNGPEGKKNSEWMYNVTVYPKNHEATGTVILNKVDQNGDPVTGTVTFQLDRKKLNKDGTVPTTAWDTNITSTKNDLDEDVALKLETVNGVLTLANLPANLYGTLYRLTELTAPDGYIVNPKPLYFTVKATNEIVWNEENNGASTYSEETKDTTGYKNENTGAIVHNVTDNTTLNITLRNERPSLTKEVKVNSATESWSQDTQYSFQDVIDYRITAYVPHNISELAQFEIKDVPAVGITDSNNTAEYAVYYASTANDVSSNTATSLNASNWTLTPVSASGTNGQGFTIALENGAYSSVAGKFIQIRYKARLNSSATVNGEGNANDATLSYKYLASTTTPYTITDECRVYTYQFEITKWLDAATTGTKAGGVNFELLLEKEGAAQQMVSEGNGVYRLATAEDMANTAIVKTTTLTTKETDGTLLIKGLENQDYWLKEIKTVDNYNLLSEPFKITVTTKENTTWSGTTTTETKETIRTFDSVVLDNVDSQKANIINKKGFVLPQTGSMGYLLFCTIGFVMVAGGTVMLFGTRKKVIR